MRLAKKVEGDEARAKAAMERLDWVEQWRVIQATMPETHATALALLSRSDWRALAELAIHKSFSGDE